MADSMPTRNDIDLLFKKLRSVPTNKVCFDCTAKNPTWASVTYGVFICIDCSAVHRSLGVHLTFVRSTQLDTNWTWIQLRQMQLGGNANAESFFHQHNCSTKDSQQKYNSRAAQLYKDKLYSAALHTIKINGSKIQLDQDSDAQASNKVKDYDFFDEHSSNTFDQKENLHNSINNYSSDLYGGSDYSVTETAKSLGAESGPKHIIGNKKVHTRSGVGNKKVGGLGAKKITTDFAEIEREAEIAGKVKEGITSEETQVEEKNEQLTSMRLMYEDLSLKKKQEEEKIMAVDPSKARQMERLGMGFTARSGISHSALYNMKTIQQENILRQRSPERDDDDFFELDFSLSGNSNSDYLLKNWPESRNSRNVTESKNISSIGEKKEVKITKFCDDLTQNSEKKQSSFSASDTNEAQKKFGSAKSISSDQFFSDNSDNTWERSANLSRFEGSSSISSADYFNRKENIGGISASSGNLIPSALINTPDLDDVRESVRQGVTKVAGRLSSLANGVMSSIQEKYGGY